MDTETVQSWPASSPNTTGQGFKYRHILLCTAPSRNQRTISLKKKEETSPSKRGKGGWELGYRARQGRLTEDWGLGSCFRGRRPSRVAHSCGKPELGLGTYLLITIHA